MAAYHRGRAEVTGFAVADQAVVGNVAGALTNLRWALNVGVPAVVIADALADGVRTVARVLGAGPGDPFRLAPALGMPPWKVKRARGQARGWAEPGLRQALGVVAALNADVKGAAADPALRAGIGGPPDRGRPPALNRALHGPSSARRVTLGRQQHKPRGQPKPACRRPRGPCAGAWQG